MTKGQKQTNKTKKRTIMPISIRKKERKKEDRKKGLQGALEIKLSVRVDEHPGRLPGAEWETTCAEMGNQF